MALNKANLKSALQDIFSTLPATAAEAATRWASAYGSYAGGAQSCSGTPNPASIVAAQAVLETSLASAFTSGTASSTAAGIAAALTAFWLTPPVVFIGPTPGAVTVVSGTGLVQSGLEALWLSNVASSATASDAAQGHADIFDALTKTVLVVHVPPAPCSALLV